MSKKIKMKGINKTPGRMNYVSTNDEIDFAIYYLVSNDLNRVMVQGKNDIVAENENGKKHYIQVKETSKSYLTFKKEEIADAIVNLVDLDNENVEKLVIISNVNIVPSSEARCLEDIDFLENKSNPHFSQYKNALKESDIDLDKFRLIRLDTKNIDPAIQILLRNMIKKVHGDKILFDEEKALESIRKFLREKARKLIDETIAENVPSQFISMEDIKEMAVTSINPKLYLKKFSTDIFKISEREDFAKLYTSDLSQLNLDFTKQEKIKEMKNKFGDKMLPDFLKSDFEEIYFYIFKSKKDERYMKIFIESEIFDA